MICFALFLIILPIGIKSDENSADQSQNGFGYELLLSKFDVLESRVKELFDQQKEGFQQVEAVLKQLDRNKRKIVHEPALEYTEHSKFGGGWLIVLQRFDGSESFNRSWLEYRNGFGKVGSELWLGLEPMHQLTSTHSYELLVELEDFEGNYGYARYDKFAIGSEADFYPLKKLGTYSGTAGDSLSKHRGAKFSTARKGFQNCRFDYSGRWWFNSECYTSYLTGQWNPTNEYTSIIWLNFNGNSESKVALKYARMMIRKL